MVKGIIIIIIILIIHFMQGIYTYIPETSYVPTEYSVAAILLLLFMVLISLVSVLNLLKFYNCAFPSMCAVFITIIIIIIIISKSFTKYLNNIPGRHEINELQKKKKALFCTAHTNCGKSCNTVYRRNVVCLRYIIVNSLHKGDNRDDDDDDNINNNSVLNNITCSTYCKYRTAATLYTVEMWCFSGVYL